MTSQGQTAVHTVEVKHFQTGYQDVLRLILAKGEETAPRGMKTIEVIGSTIIVESIENALPLNIGRGLNPAIAAAEAAHLVGGISDAQQLLNIGPQFEEFMENGRLRGAYGPRLFNQLPTVVRRLTEDSDTRQACAMIWRHDEADSRDVPCTCMVQFMIRNGRLTQRTVMRSNDAWLGLPYDVFFLSRLQATMAQVLEVEPGPYIHQAGSLHLYEGDLVAAEELVSKPWPEPTGFQPGGFPPAVRHLDPNSRWANATATARWLATGKGGVIIRERDLTPTLHWYEDHLRPHRSGGDLCSTCRYVVPEPLERGLCYECRAERTPWVKRG